MAGDRWFVDETYVKVNSRWRYVYRAVDQQGQVIDVYISRRRDTASARIFFAEIAPRPGGCIGHTTIPTQDVAPVSGVSPVGANFRILEIGMQAIKLSLYHAGPQRIASYA